MKHQSPIIQLDYVLKIITHNLYRHVEPMLRLRINESIVDPVNSGVVMPSLFVGALVSRRVSKL